MRPRASKAKISLLAIFCVSRAAITSPGGHLRVELEEQRGQHIVGRADDTVRAESQTADGQLVAAGIDGEILTERFFDAEDVKHRGGGVFDAFHAFDAAQTQQHFVADQSRKGHVVDDHRDTRRLHEIGVIRGNLVVAEFPVNRRNGGNRGRARPGGVTSQIFGSQRADRADMDDDRDAPRRFVEHGFDKHFALVARAEEAFAGGTGQIQPLRAVLDELGGQRAGAGEIQRLVLIKGRNP